MGEGAPLFLLHGGGPGCTAWSDFVLAARMFARHRRCIMPDLLQYGRSDKQVIHRQMWTYLAGMLVGLMAPLGVARADFVCDSWGGTISLSLRAPYPDRGDPLVISGYP